MDEDGMVHSHGPAPSVGAVEIGDLSVHIRAQD